MPQVRKFICDVCEDSYQEESYGDGAPSWGQLMGIKLDGIQNPTLCPAHLAILAESLDKMKQKVKETRG